MDDHDQDALGQVHKADQERVPEGIFYSVVKSGQNRENIKAGQQQEEGYDKQHRFHDLCTVSCHHHQCHPPVHCDDRKDNEHDQPDDRRLLKILFKGLKISFYDIRVIPSRHFDRHIIQCRNRRSCRKNRNTADDCQHVQDHQVGNLAQKDHDRAVQVKKLHSYIPLFSCCQNLSKTVRAVLDHFLAVYIRKIRRQFFPFWKTWFRKSITLCFRSCQKCCAVLAAIALAVSITVSFAGSISCS